MPRNFYDERPAGCKDNYVDEYFLQGLVHKNSFPELNYLKMVRQTSEILQVLNSIVLLIVSIIYRLNSIILRPASLCSEIAKMTSKTTS